MAASKRSQLSVDVDGKRSTKGAGKEKRVPNLDNDFIITTRVKKGLKRWKFLQTEIRRKQTQVEKGVPSKRLEPYKKERDGLVEQMQKDIPELQSIFNDDDEYSNAFDRKDKRRTTTGDMQDKNREALSLRSAESKINHMKSQLEQEMKSKDEALSSLRSAESKINHMKSQLEQEMKSKDEALSRLNRKLDESENEKVALKVSHNEEIGVYKEEIRKLQGRLTIDKSYEERAKELKRKCDELETELASSSLPSAELEINQLKGQIENERKSKEEDLLRLNRELDESENEKVALKVSHKEEIGVHKEEIRKLQERLTIEKSYEELKRKYDELETELARSQKKLKEEERENKTVKYRLEDEKRRTEEELKRLQATTNQLTNQLANERKAKEDALLRLSSMASNKLRDNNPNIADLSDPNRPTKLSEQFSELYDNEWTDAFDDLEKLLGDKEDKKEKEKEIISYLRDFVLEIHSACSDLSFSKLKTIEEAFVKPSVPSENNKISIEILKTIKDGIKSMAPKLLEHTRELVLGRLEEKYLNDPVASCLQHHNVKRYIDRCTEVCWYMSVQDPQLIVDGSKSPDEKFDSNKHREYTKKGPYEEFVVWPVLYLYKGGQMLSKGVAQGAKKEMI